MRSAGYPPKRPHSGSYYDFMMVAELKIHEGSELLVVKGVVVAKGTIFCRYAELRVERCG